jgi:carbonic anhydrase
LGVLPSIWQNGEKSVPITIEARMLKRGLDQVTAWILAVFVGGAVFGTGYLVTKAAARQTAEADGGEEGGEHGAAVRGTAIDGPEGEEGAGEHGGGGHGEGEHDGGHASAAHGEDDEQGVAVRGEGEHGAAEHGAAEHGGGEHGGGEHGAAEHGGGEHGGGEHGAPEHGGDEHGATEAAHQDAGRLAANGSMAAKALPHWEYKGSTGPDHWGELSSATAACGSGQRQSPVDIEAPATDAKLLPIRFTYKPADVTIRNTGHGVQLDYPFGNYVEIDGERFDLVSATLHAPSEHKLSGIPYDMELQITHRSADGKLAVVAVLFEEGKENTALAPVWAAIPPEIGSHPVPVDFDLSPTLPRKRQFFHYQGSLTTPPCSEGVRWFVLSEPVGVSAKQVDLLAQVVKFNARPVQPLHGRRVSRSTR